MAIRYGYFDSEVTGVDENGMPVFDRAETSDLFRLLFANLVSSGVLATPGDCFKVNADTGLTVRIRPGFAMINGAFAYDAEESTVTLAAANANLPRIDRVVLRCNYLNRLCEIITKTGTPASIPAAPELLQPASGDYYELCLATIRVEAGATSVTQSAITDTRGDSSVCGFITQLIDHLDTSEFMDQLTTWQEEYSAEQQAAFSTWFEAMKDQLSEDAAGNLQLQMDNLNRNIGTVSSGLNTLRNEVIGSENMGTTATTVTGAIKEHQDVLDDLDNKKAWKLIQDADIRGGTVVQVPDDAKEIYVAVYAVWTSTEKVCVDFHIPVMGHLFNPSSGAAITYHTNYWSFGTGPTGKYGVVQIQTSRDNSHYYAKLHAAYSATADVTSSTYCRMFYR